MNKKIKVLFLVLIIVTLSYGCGPKISTDEYNVIQIFEGSKTFTYERTFFDQDPISVIYSYHQSGDNVEMDCIIDFEEGTYMAGTVFNKYTLRPVTSYKGNTFKEEEEKNWKITAKFNDVLHMEAVNIEGEQIKTLDIPDLLIDNESLVFAIGALSLEEGFEKIINVSMIEAGLVSPFRVKEMGRETVTVPYGEIDCIKVEVRYNRIVLGIRPRMYLWYSNDDNRFLIQYENAGTYLKLTGIQ